MVQMPTPPIVVDEPVKHWAVVPCHMPMVRDARGHCMNPRPPVVHHVTLAPMTCHDLIVETLRECHEDHHDAR